MFLSYIYNTNFNIISKTIKIGFYFFTKSYVYAKDISICLSIIYTININIVLDYIYSIYKNMILSLIYNTNKCFE